MLLDNTSIPTIRISSREKEILSLIAFGYTDRDIAHELCLSPNTIQTHRRNLLEKFEVNNACALVYKACKLKIL